jgi:formyltetrahydrofolate hydrolase
MTQKAGDPQISWQTIVGAVAIVGLMNSALWVVMRTQFENVDKTEAYDRAEFDKYLTKAEHQAYLVGIQARLEGLSARVTTLEKQQTDTFSKLAHDPVENRTFQVESDALDKRINLIQSNIDDLNRQIAAVVAVDNAATIKAPPR